MSNSFFTFHNLIGQAKAKELLKKAVARNKIGHAYLFRGPDGVGKKRTALTLAYFINCLSPDHQGACGRCSSCRKFHGKNHPDLLHIKPDGSMIKINQIRELKHALSFPPFEAKYRVVLLEDVHTMRREAANSLLKTLEEPPEGNLLVLTADEAAELLPTIVSRCRVIPFHALPYDQVTQILKADDEISDETAQTLTAVAEGSLGLAKLLHDKGLLSFRREVVDNILRFSPDQPEIVPLIFQLAEKAAGYKEQIKDLFGLLKIWLRDLILLKVGGPESMVISRDLASSWPTARERWSLMQLFDKLLQIDQAEKELQRNCNHTLVCEVLFLNLA